MAIAAARACKQAQRWERGEGLLNLIAVAAWIFYIHSRSNVYSLHNLPRYDSTVSPFFGFKPPTKAATASLDVDRD